MKYELKKEFTDLTQQNDIGYFFVNPDKDIYFGNRNQYPITWNGKLNEFRIEIILKNSDSSTMKSYEFVEYPQSEDNLKEKIISWIDKYINEKWG
ncbi:hypothetical protein [uncultured Polaribacter sp.]|uniref:hypothetical protein n=1 Tax=uncultured Polaribacter sp. TaxID=174711 RepID=UPI0026028367|nr:hypothetical protein [uncultured Polaribacter sp.]